MNPDDITEAVRAAVRRQDCAERGHLLSANTALHPSGHGGAEVRGPDGQRPHLSCRNCGQVWLVDPTPHDSYAAAVAADDPRA